MSGVRTMPTSCPSCGYLVDAASSVPADGLTPKEGDFSVCACCHGVAVFRADQTLRAPTDAELASFQTVLAALRERSIQ